MNRSIPSSVSSYASRPFQPCGFTPLRRLTPRRSCPRCFSGSRPWGSSSFHPGTCVLEIPAMRSCPSKLSLRRWPSSLDTAEASCDARCPCGEALTSCPAVTRSVARLAPSLEACESCRPEGPSNPRLDRSRAPAVHQPPYRLAVRSPWEVAFPLRPRPRGVPPSSGPLQGRRFQRALPGAPVGLGSSYLPACARR